MIVATYNCTTHRYDAQDDAGTVHGSGWTHADALRAAGFDVVMSGLWDLPLPDDAPGDDSPETGPTTGDDTAPLPATPAGAMRAAPDAQGVGSPWHARQAWARSEARRRGLAHDGGAL